VAIGSVRLAAPIGKEATTTKRFKTFLSRYFYFCMSLALSAVVIVGFSRTANDHLFHANPPRPLLLWMHAAAFSAWMVFFIAQSALVRARKVSVHRLLGWFGAGLAAVMIVLGFIIAVVMARFDTIVLHQQGADAFLSVPFADMIMFGSCIGLAFYWRKKPEYRRRLVFHSDLPTYGCCPRQIRFRIRPQSLLPRFRRSDRARHAARLGGRYARP
jgi:hypothetical protein